MRRVGTLKRCIENVYTLIPPETDVIPDRNLLDDAQINIQAFVANVYGAIDNLAWIWLYERGLDTKIHRTRVGLRAKHTDLRATFSDSFRAYLQKIDPWLEYQIEYRDALAHRIPLYVPPGVVKPKDADAYNDLSRRMTEALYVKRDGFEYERLSAEQEKLLWARRPFGGNGPAVARRCRRNRGNPKKFLIHGSAWKALEPPANPLTPFALSTPLQSRFLDPSSCEYD